MSKIDDLLLECCPTGINHYTLGELGNFYGGLTGKSKNDFIDGNAVFITYRNVYSNPALDIHPLERVKIGCDENQRTLQYGDVIFTGSSETPDECGFSSVVTEPLYLNSFCFFFRFDKPEIMLPHFAKHLFRSDHLRYQIGKTANGVTRFNVSKDKMANVSIPIPPLEIQQEIVRILDSFTALTAELQEKLQAELTARKQQYQYYLDRYFEKQNDCLIPLREVGTLTRGKRFVHADAVEEGVPCIHYGELYTYYGTHADKVKSYIRAELREKMRYAHKGDVVIVGAGENNIDIGVGVSWEGEEDVAVHDACYTLTHDQNSRYISYYLRSHMYHEQIKKYVSSGKICAISADGIGRALIPVPSIERQNAIVSVLDRFEVLCNSISDVIPTEITLREQQYEYYRNKILTFSKGVKE